MTIHLSNLSHTTTNKTTTTIEQQRINGTERERCDLIPPPLSGASTTLILFEYDITKSLYPIFLFLLQNSQIQQNLVMMLSTHEFTNSQRRLAWREEKEGERGFIVQGNQIRKQKAAVRRFPEAMVFSFFRQRISGAYGLC